MFEKCQHVQPAGLLPPGRRNFSLKSARIPAKKLLARGPKSLATGHIANFQTSPSPSAAACATAPPCPGWDCAAHIPDQLQLRFCVLVWRAVGPPGLADQGFCSTIPASPPEVDIRPALVKLPAGTADAVFLRVLHQGLPVCHVLCYTLAHEGYGPLSSSCCLQLQLYPMRPHPSSFFFLCPRCIVLLQDGRDFKRSHS